MGPAKYRGIGWNGSGQGSVNAPPVAPGNGSGGAGSILATPGASLAPAKGEISDALAGQITLGVVNLTILALLAFYVYTRGMQSGA